MNLESLREYCLAKPHATEGLPFGPTVLVLKVGGKMFGLLPLDTEDLQINLKCDPERAIQLREEHDSILPGYHMSKKHWNTVLVNGLKNSLVLELIDHSYELAFESLPKKVLAELGI
jgi:predicted DNA-binding protein (MmcQ/YjbR family)